MYVISSNLNEGKKGYKSTNLRLSMSNFAIKSFIDDGPQKIFSMKLYGNYIVVLT